MEKVRPWCDQPSDRGRLRNRTVAYCGRDAVVRQGSPAVVKCSEPNRKVSAVVNSGNFLLDCNGG